MGLKRRKVVFGPRFGWGIVPLTQSHLHYLHDKSWSQGEPQSPGSFIYSFLYQHHFPFIRGEWQNDSRYLDFVLHTPWEIGQGITSVPVTCFHLHLGLLNEYKGKFCFFYIPRTAPSLCELPIAGIFKECFKWHHFSSTLRTQLLQDYKSMKRVIWIFFFFFLLKSPF